jgi:DNA polymerase-3 subunit alpha
MIEQATRERQALESGQGFLFALDPEEPAAAPAAATAAVPTVSEALLAGERETLGFYLSGHPLDRWARVLRELRATPVAELGELYAGGAATATVAGLATGVKVRATKEGRNQGKRMASLNVEDQTGSVRAVAFSDVYEKYERLLADGAAVLVTASLRAADGEHVELRVEQVARLEGIEGRRASALRIELDLAVHGDQETLDRVHDALLHHGGKLGVRLRLRGADWTADVVPNRVDGIDPESAIPALNAILGPGRTEYVYNGNGG